MGKSLSFFSGSLAITQGIPREIHLSKIVHEARVGKNRAEGSPASLEMRKNIERQEEGINTDSVV